MTASTQPIEWEAAIGLPGRYRVACDQNGFWWFLDPWDRPFFYRGVCGVNRAGTQGGRYARPGPYAEAVDRIHAYQENPYRFVGTTLERLRAWGFNALGSWATVEFFDLGFPYTEIIEFSKVGPTLKERGLRIADVFSKEWVAGADALARELAAPRRESRDLIGYFTDNELGWGQPDGFDIDDNPDTAEPKRASLYQAALGMPPDSAVHEAAWKHAVEHHGDVARALAAWGVDTATTPEGFGALQDADTILKSPRFIDDHRDFSRLFARRYFSITAAAIRRYDPYHLIIGPRFGGPPGRLVLEAMEPQWVDIVSANNYRHTFAERIDSFYNVVRRPVLNGEFAWASGYFTEIPMDDEPEGMSVPDRALKKGEAALREAFAHPGLVGYTWYRWVQNPKHAPIGYGLVDALDEPNRWNTDQLARLNPQAEDVRREAARALGRS